jgi:hypothetical protein
MKDEIVVNLTPVNHALLKMSHERRYCCQFDTGLKYNFFNMRVHLGICLIFFIN